MKKLFQKQIPNFAAAIFAAYFYVFMEWVFFVTKPSFMDFLSLTEKINILFQSGLFVSLLVFMFFGILAGADFLLQRFTGFHPRLDLFAPVLVSAALGLMLLDNFTYTVFGFGVVSSTNPTRLFYVVFLCYLLYYFYREFLQFIYPANPAKMPRQLFVIAVILLTTSATFLAIDHLQNISTSRASVSSNLSGVQKPNIIILGTDGLSAAHMSLYGYSRNTTPIIDELAATSLVAENHFTNACCTIGSTLSSLTGKLPTSTHVLVPPDILHAEDSYQHIVNILNAEGYTTIQWGNTIQVNGDKWNMRSGFDVINGVPTHSGFLDTLRAYFFNDNANYFVDEMTGRLGERILHVFYIRDMEKPLTSTENNYEADDISDTQKVRDILKIIEKNESPFFIHAHLMGTHGGLFVVRKRVFSAGKIQNANWDVDFMDDAILQYDQYVERVLGALRKSGQIDNTIFIVYTDHEVKWAINKKIPLVMRFPNGAHVGRITANTQNIDIVPTVLDYMKIPQPEWMEGDSLLSPVDAHRLVFSFQSSPEAERGESPYFQFRVVNAIECQKWYSLDLKTNEWQSGDVAGHTAPCVPSTMRPPEAIRKEMLGLFP